MKIAFYAVDRDKWHGGISHLRSLFCAIKKTFKNDTSLILLKNTNSDAGSSNIDLCADETLQIPELKRKASRVTNRIIFRLFGYDLLVRNFIKKHKFDLLFGVTLTTSCGNVPTLSWIYDFQHHHLPEMFNCSERDQRDKTFLQTAKMSTRIIVMSESVKRDFERFAPQYVHKVRVLKTACYIPESVYDTSPEFVVSRYYLPENFFYLPNQFWKHKNHEFVFQAVKQLKDQGLKVNLVCSGHFVDYRHSSYFADLWQKLSRWNIRNQIIYLGLIPYEHVFQLMRQSICVINPSLFEGFGLTVDEARSLGKKVLLSDIEVFREQNPPKGVFFNPEDPKDLAEKMDQIWHDTMPGPDNNLEKKAREILPERLRESAYSFISVANEALHLSAHY